MATIPRQEKVLRRSRSHRIIGGVCGGLAEYFGVDPVLVRVIFVVIAIFAGSGLLLYILLWLLVPMESAEATAAGS